MDLQYTIQELEEAKRKGPTAFTEWLKDRIATEAGGTLDVTALHTLSAAQITLWAYYILRDEVMEGGFVQLIVNGWGPFFFRNPFAKAIKLWGISDLSAIIRKAGKRQSRNPVLENPDISDEAFMALFEQYPEFDALDDAFVDQETEFTAAVSDYVYEHTEAFLH